MINSQLPPFVPGSQVSIPESYAATAKKPKSRYKGVFKCGKKFKAQIQTNGVQHYLGLFDNEEEAAKAYDMHARVVLGPKAKTNFEYDPNEPIPAAEIPSVSVLPALMQTKEPVVVPVISQPAAPRLPGSHPKRTYVGIKLRKKGDVNNSNTVNRQFPTTANYNYSGGEPSNSAMNMMLEASVGLQGATYCGYDQQTGHKRGRVDGQFDEDESHVDAYGRPVYRGMDADGNYYYHYGGETASSFQEQQGREDIAEEDEDPDWREQIYYWTGSLAVDVSNSCLSWKGSWVGSYTGRPEVGEFLLSNNYFEYTSEVIADVTSLLTHRDGGSVCEDAQEIGNSDLLLRPPSSFFRGFYMMDNDGSGSLERYLDKDYYIEFDEIKLTDQTAEHDSQTAIATEEVAVVVEPPVYSVLGKGDSDFGVFILTGTFDSALGVMEMARLYIADDDPRCGMDLQTLKRHITSYPM